MIVKNVLRFLFYIQVSGIVSILPMMNPNVMRRSSVLAFIIEFRVLFTLLRSPNF
jgi:hypothetical protein